MRWLFVKDLQIMRRSPLLTALLIIYPIAIAVLIGFALSRGPAKPRVAFLSEIPPGTPLVIGGQELDITGARGELCSRIDCIDVSNEDEAKQMVESGDALAALILPKDFISNLQSLASLNPTQPTVRVLVNEEDPIKASLVDDRISALINQANLMLSKKVTRLAANYLTLLLRGGNFSLLGQTLNVLGLEKTQRILEAIQPELSKDSQFADALQRVITFARLARQNLDLATPLLSSIAHPIEVDKEVVSGSPPSLDAFAIAVAATVTLMFVTVLLVAGSLALEREENAFARLTRGLVAKWALLGEKVALGVALSILVTLVMLGGLSLFVHIDWGRFPLILLAIAVGGAGFAAFGAAIGAAAKEVRASSLLAFMISLPIAFISLVESGTVSPALFDVIKVIRALFPFDAALDAMSGGLDASGPALGLPILHLAILAAAYAVLARIALRRFV
ncbi:MAG TPA: ABC transporter permease [Solirubrobacterales bacterium]|nr:ABC transporter permease [Solirubrobacterales bacterium]